MDADVIVTTDAEINTDTDASANADVDTDTDRGVHTETDINNKYTRDYGHTNENHWPSNTNVALGLALALPWL